MLVLIGSTHKAEKAIKASGGKLVKGLGIKELGGVDFGWKVSPAVARTYRGQGENRTEGIYVFRIDGDINKRAMTKDIKAEEAR